MVSGGHASIAAVWPIDGETLDALENGGQQIAGDGAGASAPQPEATLRHRTASRSCGGEAHAGNPVIASSAAGASPLHQQQPAKLPLLPAAAWSGCKGDGRHDKASFLPVTEAGGSTHLGSTHLDGSGSSTSPVDLPFPAPFVEGSQAVDLPFRAHSYVVKTMEKGAALSFTEAAIDTPAWLDMVYMLGALAKAVLAMYIAVLQDFRVRGAAMSWGEYFLALFSMVYPLLTMLVLVARVFETSCRKELYWVLLKHRVVMDWTNWVWVPRKAVFQPMGPRCIWLQTYFTLYFLPSFALLAYWSWQISSASLAVVTILQFSGLYMFYVGTLKVERGILSFNQALEDEAGSMNFGTAKKYLDCGLATAYDKVLRRAAVVRWRSLPRRRLGLLGLLRPNPRYAAELAAWRAAAEGDLARLTSSSPEDWPVTGLASLFGTRFYGVLWISLAVHHPDLSAASKGARLFLKRNYWALALGMLAVGGIQVYGLLTQIRRIAGAT